MGNWHIASQLKMLSLLHMEFVISVLGWRRGDGESFVEYRQGTYRGARQTLHKRSNGVRSGGVRRW